VLRKICGAKEFAVMGGLEGLRNGELSDLCCSPNIIRVMKSRGMGWVGYVACGGKRNACGLGNPKERDRLEDVGIDVRIKGLRCEGMDWISVARNRDKWRAALKTVMNFHFS
jgi:hypothetical protein